jgi:hypothetical protein
LEQKLKRIYQLYKDWFTNFMLNERTYSSFNLNNGFLC